MNITSGVRFRVVALSAFLVQFAVLALVSASHHEASANRTGFGANGSASTAAGPSNLSVLPQSG
ncbi:MAG TPA: hypothetical protein VFV34_19020, partial [Blastocatellia bacterium]|nr:hypothetical protein [Blastocatellia bacterium]